MFETIKSAAKPMLRAVADAVGPVTPAAAGVLSVEKAEAQVTRARQRVEQAQKADYRANWRMGHASLNRDAADGSEDAYSKAKEAAMSAAGELAEAKAALAVADDQYATAVAAAYERGVKGKSTAVYGAAVDLGECAKAVDAVLDTLAVKLGEWIDLRERLRQLAPESGAVNALIGAQVAFPAALATRLRFFPGMKPPLIPDPRLERWGNFMPDPGQVRDAVAKTTRSKPAADRGRKQ